MSQSSRKKEKLWNEVIEHWTRLATGNANQGESVSPRSCAFCKEYLEKSCSGCPIFEETGLEGCNGTPYEKIRNIVFDNLTSNISIEELIKTEKFSRCAQIELDWLKNLRKKSLSNDQAKIK